MLSTAPPPIGSDDQSPAARRQLKVLFRRQLLRRQ